VPIALDKLAIVNRSGHHDGGLPGIIATTLLKGAPITTP